VNLVSRMEVALREPVESDAMVTQARIDVKRQMPDGTCFRVFATNDPFDEQPHWEEVTSFVLSGDAYSFQNESCLSGRFGLSVRVWVEKGSDEGQCSISGIGGVLNEKAL
jgi:hypothetical protein